MHSVTNAIPTGTIASIPAKAHAHRALICAALASSPSTILLSRTSKDIDATMDSLRGLGAHVVYENIMKNKKARGIDIQIREGAKSH